MAGDEPGVQIESPMRAAQLVALPPTHPEIRSEVDETRVLANNGTAGAKSLIQDAEAGVRRRGSSRINSAKIPTPTSSPTASRGLCGILPRLATDLPTTPTNAHLPHERHLVENFSPRSQLYIEGIDSSSDRISAKPTQSSTFFRNTRNIDARGATIVDIGRDQVIHNGSSCTFILTKTD
jgi:hypothetical protein